MVVRCGVGVFFSILCAEEHQPSSLAAMESGMAGQGGFGSGGVCRGKTACVRPWFFSRLAYGMRKKGQGRGEHLVRVRGCFVCSLGASL